MRTCIYCSKEYKPLGISAHQRLCPKNPNKRKEDHPSFGRKGTNQHIKAKERGEVIIVSKETRRKLSKAHAGKKISEETKKKMSEAMKVAVRKYPDSYSGMNVNGRVKKIKYNGVILDGGWELCFAKWCDANDIIWERPIKGFEYQWNGSRIYYPDFYLPLLNVYVEIKGFERDRDLAKWKSVSNLIVLKLNEIRKIQRGEFVSSDLMDYIYN